MIGFNCDENTAKNTDALIENLSFFYNFCENSWIPTRLTKREICTRPEMACLTPSKSAIYDYTQHREQVKLRISSQKFWSGRVMWKVITGMFHLTN